MVIQVLVERRNLDMQLLEQFNRNKHEEEVVTVVQAAKDAEGMIESTDVAETTWTSQAAASSELERF